MIYDIDLYVYVCIYMHIHTEMCINMSLDYAVIYFILGKINMMM